MTVSGERGPLKLPNHLRSVPAVDAAPESVADVVRPVMPAKPAGLPASVSQLWDELGAALDDNGLIASCDGPTLELALRHYEVARKAADELLAAAAVQVRDDKNNRLMKHPASQVFRDHSTAYLEFAKQLGMTFVARARTPVKGGGEGGGEDNPFGATGS